jgi:hypothetical protein
VHLAIPRTLNDPLTLPARSWSGGGPMDRPCRYCGVECADQLRCPVCDTSLVRVNLRRSLLWALVVEEYLLLLVVGLRFG